MSIFHDSMQFLEPYLTHYGYPVLFGVVFIESFGVPMPGQTLLIASAVLAAHGKLDITGVLLAAFCAAVLGDSFGYWIGLKGGRRLLLRFGKYVRVGETEVRRLEAGFDKYGGWFVTFARFFEVLRQINGIVAGAAVMPFRRFLLFNATGALLWVGLWGFGSWRLGRHIREYADLFDEASVFFIVGLIVLLVMVMLYLARRHWRRP